jgi:tetraacyldisaccharide 4'-kinase
VGGTGKTSLVEFIVQHLKQEGHKVAILSRGYKKSAACSLQPAGYETMGDEPYMLSKKLVDTPVIVDANRIRGAAKAVEDYSADTVVLDDGFQQWKIFKDLEIVTIDSTNPFGNRNMLPRGILREPLRSLKRADIFVLTKTNFNPDTTALRKELNSFNPRAEVFEAEHKAGGVYEFNQNSRLIDAGYFKEEKVALFSGIADPDSFEKLARELGIDIGLHLRFPDHHHYTADDLNKILSASKEKGMRFLLTTEKDAARLTENFTQGKGCRLFVLRLKVLLTKNEQGFFARLHKLYPV